MPPDYDSALNARLQAVLKSADQARQAISEALQYWKDVYSNHIPNADNALFPPSLFDEDLPRASKELATIRERISAAK